MLFLIVIPTQCGIKLLDFLTISLSEKVRLTVVFKNCSTLYYFLRFVVPVPAKAQGFCYLPPAFTFFFFKYNTLTCTHFKCSSWCVLTNVNIRVTTSHHNQDILIECFHQLTKFPPVPSQSALIGPQVQATTDQLCNYWLHFTFVELHTNETIQYVFFLFFIF